MPASTRSTYSPRAASKPCAPVAAQHPVHDHAAVHRRVLGDLPRRRLERAPQELHAGALVALGGSPRPSPTAADAAQQRQPAARHDALGDRRLGRADRVVERVLARLHLRLRRRADADHRHAARELGEPLLELLLVVVAGGLLDLAADLRHAARRCALRSPAPPMIVVVSLSATTRLARPSCVELHVLELDAELLGDELPAGQHRHVREHRLAAVAEARRLDRDALQHAADLVDDQRRERLALDVLGDEQQRPARTSPPARAAGSGP